MIVVYAPFPNPHQVRDGWMRRIAALERIFAGRERAYVFPADAAYAGEWCDYRVHTDEVAPGATFTWLDFRFSLHHRFLTDLVERCEFVYAHTSHSMQHLLPYYATGKIVTDLHGIAPEEEDLQGRPGRAAFHSGFEETMVRRSALLVTVTEAMAAHFARKYPGCDRPTIQLPIVDELGDAAPPARPPRARPIVVYVGGLQRWQNVGRMLEVVAACRDRCEFRFYTDAPAALQELASAAGVADAVRIGTAAPAELPALLGEADLGFVLRDDTPVNRVSCPTKLSEYLALGVVPVVALAAIGDFESLGYRHVPVDDLLAGRLPDAATLQAMRQRNREVYDAIRGGFATGERRIRELRIDGTAARVPASALLTTLERSMFFPVRGAAIEVERESGSHTVALDDLVQARVDVTAALPGHGAVRTIRVRLGDAPFVTTPVELWLVDAAGREHRVPVSGGHTVDAYGNWSFAERGAGIVARGRGIAAARVRLRTEYLLLGPEALVVRLQPLARRRAWRQRLFRIGAKVPGARAVWSVLQRLRGRS